MNNLSGSFFRTFLFIAIGLTVGFKLTAQYKQKDKLANTLLWEISGKNMQESSYLFGTMHVSEKIAFHLQDSFLIAISNVEHVALEVNPETWLSEMFKSALFGSAMSYYNMYSDYDTEFYNTITSVNPPDDDILKEALIDNSDLINHLLYRFAGSTDNRNYEETTYLDLYIYQTGKKLKKKMLGLENFEKSMQMTMQAMLPDSDEDENSIKNKRKRTGYTVNVNEKIEKAYRRWNLNELDSLMKLTYTSKNYEKYLIIERNKIMANSMDSIMQTGSLFAAVGAAHLPGETGLINLLKADGYTVRPVLGEETFSGKKQRDKMKKKLFTHETKSCYLPDSLLQYTLPDSLVRIPSDNEHGFFLYPDMVNGSYYSIYRLQHYSQLYGKTVDDIILNIDSMLYESVPGEILKRKKIVSNAGHPGVMLSSKLPNGDFMEFHIYYTPLEVIVCKAGGSQQAFKSKEWKTFFSSVKFTGKNTSTGFTTYNQPMLGYSVDFPVDKAVHSYTNNINIFTKIQAFYPVDSSFCFFSLNCLNDFEYLEDDTFELSFITDRLSEELKTHIINKKLIINSNAIEATHSFNDNKNFLHTRVVIQGPFYYIMGITGNNKELHNSYFRSFRLFNQADNFPSYKLVDSTMHFSTLSDEKDFEKKQLFAELIDKVKNSTYSWKDKEENNYRTQTKVYNSKNKPLTVMVERQKINKYMFVKHPDSIWFSKSYLKYSDEGNYIDKSASAEKYNKTLSDSILSKAFFIKDSLSTRALLVKKIIINDHLFTLTTVIDTGKGADAWQEKFYNNFQPWDTCAPFDLSVPKSSVFISDLNAADSTIYKSAINSCYLKVLRSDKNVIEGVCDFVQTPAYKTLDIDEKKALIRFLGNSDKNKKKSIECLKLLYEQAGDTVALQLQVLNSLAYLSDTLSFRAIAELMEQNLPLTNYNYEIIGMFETFSDSLELTKLLFPQFFEYLQYPEYKEPVLELMAELSIHNKLNVDLSVSKKKFMLRDAKIEMKRYKAELSKKTGSDNDYNNYSEGNYSIYAPWNTGEDLSVLACYSVIFAPFYASNHPVKLFIDEILSTKNEELVYSCAVSLKHSGQAVNDTIWHWLASKAEIRRYFYDWLKQTKDTVLFPKEYHSQDSMSLSWITTLNNRDKKDSIRFIGKYYIADVVDSGYVYLYKYKSEDTWKLNYVGLQPADTMKITTNLMYYKYSGIEVENNDEEKLEEAVSDAFQMIRTRNRRRVNSSLWTKKNSYDWEY